jgi:hypothetical protein
MRLSDLKKSKFLKKEDVTPPVLVTISGCEEVNVAKEGVEPEMRWAMNFKELEKPLILNSTNGQIIAAISGSEESDDWIGKKIVLYNDPNIFFGGKMTGGIRVRPPKQARPTTQTIDQAKKDMAAHAAKRAEQRTPEPDPDICNEPGADDEPF